MEEEKKTKKAPAKATAAKTPAATKKPAAKTAKPAAAKSAKPAETKAKPAAKKPATKAAAKKPADKKPAKAKPAPAQEAEEFDEEIVSLQNDKGEQVDFFHIATIDYKNEWFVFFQPVVKTEDIGEDEVVVFKLEEDEDGEDAFLPVESEELLQAVYGEYLSLINNLDENGNPSSCGGSCEGCSGCH